MAQRSSGYNAWVYNQKTSLTPDENDNVKSEDKDYDALHASIHNKQTPLTPDEKDHALTEEEEYDARNDETFGWLEDSSVLNDWQQQDEELAATAESTKPSKQLEKSIFRSMLADYEQGSSIYNASIYNKHTPFTLGKKDYVLTEEKEYDARNDETLGRLEDSSVLNDWHQQDEEFAATAESTKPSKQLEKSIFRLMLEDYEQGSSIYNASIYNKHTLFTLGKKDYVLTEEEEYDARNDETFGRLEDSSVLNDWQQQDEQFAAIAESAKSSEQLEKSIFRLMLEDYEQGSSIYNASIYNKHTPFMLGKKDYVLTEEEEYDACNDETFGKLEDSSVLNDWQQQDEQFAAIAESAKSSEQLEKSISCLMLKDYEQDPFNLKQQSIWSYTPPNKYDDTSSALSLLTKTNSDWTNKDYKIPNQEISLSSMFAFYDEKLEKNLIKSSRRQSFSSKLQVFSCKLTTNKHTPLTPDEKDYVQIKEEDYYNACNDETFRGLKDSSVLNDWQQHDMQLAATSESTEPSEQLKKSISCLMLEDYKQDPFNLKQQSIWSYTPPNKYDDTSSALSLLKKTDSNWSNKDYKIPNQEISLSSMFASYDEELEKNQIKSSRQQPFSSELQVFSSRSSFQYQLHPRLPPGLFPNSTLTYHSISPGLLPGRLMRQRDMMYSPGNPQFSVNHLYNFSPPLRNYIPLNEDNRNNMQQQKTEDHSYKHRNVAGLMTNWEKQWLFYRQMSDLNTETPYFDDYYYTIFKERKAKNNKENFADGSIYGFQNNRQYRNNDWQENNNWMFKKKLYPPPQYEKTLSKKHLNSITAPAQILDIKILTPKKNSNNIKIVHNTTQTKQQLLNIEAYFTLLLKAEDLCNPLAISNMKTLRERRRVHHLRELDLAPTYVKREKVLKLIKKESKIENLENSYDYIAKIVNNLLQEKNFDGILNIRKGKTLLLRLLPHLTTNMFSSKLLKIWTKVLLSIPIVGKRDRTGDNIMPKYHPFFKTYLHKSTMGDILDIVTKLVEIYKQEKDRKIPLSYHGKTPLYYILLDKFGVSALVSILVRSEYLISSENASQIQQEIWSNFLVTWAELTGVVSNVQTPIEPVSSQVFNKHCNRFKNLLDDKKSLLVKHFVYLK